MSGEVLAAKPIAILIADDEPVNRMLLQAMVRSVVQRRFPGRDLHVDLADDGREALRLLNERRYSGLLLDLMMPEVDGFGVLSQMKARGDRTPVVVVTAVDRGLRSRVPLGQVLSILPKPVDAQRLGDIISALVEQAWLQGR